ncbi:MAG: hypothetical protein R3261_07005, partial [Alphaproteobacteria bacterium]|nr:hypothetical protein [Alphaproteobacteria bacterium]
MTINLPLVTGANDFVFPNLLIFLESCSRFMPDEKIYVADFGLTKAQRFFLEEKGLLLPLPTKLEEFDHAWYRKASLAEYVQPLDTDSFVWLDCDMILTEDIRVSLYQEYTIMKEKGSHIALCQDAG